MKHSAKEREKRVRNLSTSLEKREKYQSSIEKALKIKRAFQDKYENLKNRVQNGRDLHLKRLSIVIAKAYVSK
jgi:hypothetical protein